MNVRRRPAFCLESVLARAFVMDKVQLDTLTGFVTALQQAPQVFMHWDGLPQRLGTLYCPRCGDVRRVEARLLHGAQEARQVAAGGGVLVFKPESLVSSLFSLICVQCDTTFTALIYRGPGGPDLAILPSCSGGLTTPHTPPSVAYYLDQANRSKSTGAYTAAISMFRGALEHLLFEQGYEQRMLGPKLIELEKDIQNQKAPKWALELETDFLVVLKELGDGSIHPNGGDVTKQAVLDSEMVSKVQMTFVHLLYLVYELPHRRKDSLNALQTAAMTLKKGDLRPNRSTP